MVGQLLLGFRGCKEHPILCHVKPIQRYKWLASCGGRRGFSGKRHRDDGTPRKSHSARAAANYAVDIFQHLREQDMLPAENVALPGLSITQCREMAAGHIVHM